MQVRTVQNAFFLLLVAFATLTFLGLIGDFLLPVFWAAVLTILFFPVQRHWLQITKGRKSIASVLSLLSIVVVVLLPLFLIGMALTREVLGLYERIASGEIDLYEPIRTAQQALPLVEEYSTRYGVNFEQLEAWLSSAAVTGSRFLATKALDFGQNALRILGLVFIMLYVLFFFFRDGEKLVDAIILALPLGDQRERQLFGKFAAVSRATIKGTLVVGAVQGFIGGLLFWILGIGAPVFWGVVMTMLSLLPAFGTALIWGPAAIILMITGEVTKGIILIVVGTLVIGLVDNILRPLLVGRDTEMPDYIILLSTLGGLTAYGLSGFVIGPVIAALFLSTWDMFVEEFGGFENSNGVKAAARDPFSAGVEPPAVGDPQEPPARTGEPPPAPNSDV